MPSHVELATAVANILTSTSISFAGVLTSIKLPDMISAAELGGTPAQVMVNAQAFADWVMQKDAAQAQVSHQSHMQGREQQQAPPLGDDGLPF